MPVQEVRVTGYLEYMEYAKINDLIRGKRYILFCTHRQQIMVIQFPVKTITRIF